MMTTLATILLILAGVAWAAWHWYGQHWWAHHKWDEKRIEDQRLQRIEDRAAREEAAHSAAALQHRAEELRRQRTGENLIYEDMCEKKDENRLTEMTIARTRMALQRRIDSLRTNSVTNLRRKPDDDDPSGGTHSGTCL